MEGNFAFRRMLDNLYQQNLTNEEIRRISGLFSSKRRTPIRRSYCTETLQTIIERLQDKEYVSPNDIRYLQVIFEQIQRPDLLKIVNEYCYAHENVVHLQQPAGKPFVCVVCKHIRKKHDCIEIVLQTALLLSKDPLFIMIKGDGDRLFYCNGNCEIEEFRGGRTQSKNYQNSPAWYQNEIRELQDKVADQQDIINDLQMENASLNQKIKTDHVFSTRFVNFSSNACQR